jgi:outer membrane receptor protein involved in Fe transport
MKPFALRCRLVLPLRVAALLLSSVLPAWLLAEGTNSATGPSAGPASGLFALPIEELSRVEVITASRKAEPIDMAPNVMYVITADEIKHRGLRTLQDVLQTVPGFQVFHRDLQFVAQVRGIAPNDNEKISFMVNGHSINQVWEPEVLGGAIPLENLDRIEVIVGPGSVLYGAEALTAIVNLITKKQVGNEAVITAGNQGMREVIGMVGQSAGERRNLFLSASWRERDGVDAWLANSSNQRNRNLAGTDATGRLYPSITILGHGEYDNWDLQYFGLNSEIPDLHLQGNQIADDGRRTDYIHSFRARNQSPLTDNLSSSFEVFSDYKRVLRAIVETGGGSSVFPNWDTTQTSYGAEEALHYRTENDYLQGGIQYQRKQHRHNYDYQWNPDDPSAPSEMRSIVDRRETEAVGAYLSEERKLTSWLRVVGAVRFDRDEILDNERVYTSPRAAVIYNPWDAWVAKLMYNRATRMPSPIMSPLNELWGEGNPYAPDWANSNPMVQTPEQLTTWELQSIHYFGKTRLSVNVYYQELKDFISWYSPFTNVGDFEGYGGEVDLRHRLSSRLSVWCNGAYSKNDFTTRGTRTESSVGSQAFQLPANDKGEMVGAPRYTANLGVDWEPLQSVFLSPSLRYFTHQPMYLNDEWTYADNRIYVDLALTWEHALAQNIDLRLSGQNIFNNRDPVGTQWLADAYRPRGAAAALTLTCRF